MKRDDFCTACHDVKKAAIGSDHSPDPNLSPIVNKRTGRVGETCDMCHRVHNAETKKWIFSVQGNYKNADNYCLTCHQTGGQASDKPINVIRGHVIGKLDKIPQVVKYLTNTDGVYSVECRNCHDPHINGVKRGGEGTFSSSFLKKLDTGYNLCLACHEDKDSILESGHDVAKFGKKTADILYKLESRDLCGPCHTLHNSERKYLMTGITSEERCQQCHNNPDSITEKLAKTSHLKYVDPKDNNTLRLPLENNNVVCGTCHEPHRKVKNLIRPQVAKEEMLCVSCHESRKWVSVSYHNMSVAHINDEKLKELAAVNACAPCHISHNFDPDQAYMWARKVHLNKDFIYDVCVDCHRDGGISPKVPKYLTHSKLFRMMPSNQHWQEYMYSLAGKNMSEYGEISCSTCHDPHIWSTNPDKVGEAVVYKGKKPLEGDNTTSFLKGSDVVNNFCNLCHDDAIDRYNKYHMSDFRESKTETRGILERLLKRGK